MKEPSYLCFEAVAQPEFRNQSNLEKITLQHTPLFDFILCHL